MERHCPDALLMNVTNPLTALCRTVGRTSKIKVVGLCNELIGLKFTLSLLFDAPVHQVDPVAAGVNHLPLVTELRISGEDGFAMLRSLLEDPASHGDEPIWMSPPPDGMHWRKVSDGETWTKADVLANTRVKCELFRRFGCCRAPPTPTSPSSSPASSPRRPISGGSGASITTGCTATRKTSGPTSERWPSCSPVDEVSPVAVGRARSGDLIDGIVTGTERHLPMNLPNLGQVTNLADDVVVECIGTTSSAGVAPRDTATVESVLGEYLREVSFSQELTVEAALTGDRTRVLEAMLTDQVARQLPYEHLVSMTDELLAATAPWLPQFAS